MWMGVSAIWGIPVARIFKIPYIVVVVGYMVIVVVIFVIFLVVKVLSHDCSLI